jgi:hypothetical protein
MPSKLISLVFGKAKASIPKAVFDVSGLDRGVALADAAQPGANSKIRSTLSRRRMLQVAAADATLAGCDLLSPQYKFRYRLTVTVQTPDGVQTGNGVYQVVAGTAGQFPNPGTSAYSRTSGDAFPVNLGNGKSIYVLMTGRDRSYAINNIEGLRAWDSTRLIIMNYDEDGVSRNPLRWESLAKIKEGDQFEVPIDEMPALAYFADRLRPESGAVLDPHDLAIACGPGCRVLRCEIRVTSAPVTRGIKAKLPWAPAAWPRGNFAGPHFSEHHEWFTS